MFNSPASAAPSLPQYQVPKITCTKTQSLAIAARHLAVSRPRPMCFFLGIYDHDFAAAPHTSPGPRSLPAQPRPSSNTSHSSKACPSWSHHQASAFGASRARIRVLWQSALLRTQQSSLLSMCRCRSSHRGPPAPLAPGGELGSERCQARGRPIWSRLWARRALASLNMATTDRLDQRMAQIHTKPPGERRRLADSGLGRVVWVWRMV